jgi:hypothetical protein
MVTDWGEARKVLCKGVSRPLRVLDDYLKWAAYGPGGTHGLAVRTPVALRCFNKGNDPVDYC